LDPEIEALYSMGIVVYMWQFAPPKYIPSPLFFGDAEVLSKTVNA
jgi:hypothetical protein